MVETTRINWLVLTLGVVFPLLRVGAINLLKLNVFGLLLEGFLKSNTCGCHNLTDLYVLAQVTEDNSCHICIKAGVMCLPSNVLVDTESCVALRVKAKHEIVTELLVLGTLIVEVTQIGLTELSSVACQDLCIKETREGKPPLGRKLNIAVRKLIYKLVVDKGRVVYHIVANDRFLRLEHHLNDGCEAHLLLKEVVNLALFLRSQDWR